MYFTGDNGYQNFLVFAPMLSSLTLDSNKKFNNCIYIDWNIIWKIKPFDTNLEPTMSNLANGKRILEFNNSILVKKNSSSSYNKISF